MSHAEDGLEEELEDEEDFEDEDEEDEDEEDDTPRKKKKKASAASYYVDDIADVDDEEEDEEEGHDDMGGLIAGDDEVEEGASARQSYRELMNRPTTKNRVEEIARKYEERAGGADFYEEDIEEEDPEGDDVSIVQQSLLPSVRDPKLWMVNCKAGKEREIALNIFQKFLDKENSDDRVMIKAVVCPDHLKGHVYVEADKESHVREALKGIRDLFAWKIKLVPIKEMTDVLNVTRKRSIWKRTRGSG